MVYLSSLKYKEILIMLPQQPQPNTMHKQENNATKTCTKQALSVSHNHKTSKTKMKQKKRKKLLRHELVTTTPDLTSPVSVGSSRQKLVRSTMAQAISRRTRTS
jgi:hypothetical protein